MTVAVRAGRREEVEGDRAVDFDCAARCLDPIALDDDGRAADYGAVVAVGHRKGDALPDGRVRQVQLLQIEEVVLLNAADVARQTAQEASADVGVFELHAVVGGQDNDRVVVDPSRLQYLDEHAQTRVRSRQHLLAQLVAMRACGVPGAIGRRQVDDAVLRDRQPLARVRRALGSWSAASALVRSWRERVRALLGQREREDRELDAIAGVVDDVAHEHLGVQPEGAVVETLEDAARDGDR